MQTYKTENLATQELDIVLHLSRNEAHHLAICLGNYAKLLRATTTPDAALISALYVIGNQVGFNIGVSLQEIL